MLVEYIPDEPADEQGRAGLFLRPHNPFVEGVFPERTGNLAPLEMSELEVHTFAQAAYRSEAGIDDGLSHYVLVTPDMDPPAADTRWHIAIGQMRDDRALAGTVRVTFSSSTYRAPLALQLYYDAEEEERQIGLFDPTPRTPDGDNPGTTQGEAMRWILFKAAEQLLDGLDFDGFMPIRVLVTTKPIGYGSPTGSASGIHTVGIDSAVPAPGRLRARMSGRWSNTGNGGARVRQDYLIPPVVWEREAGTDACRARPSDLLSGGLCGWGGETNEAARHPGEAGVPEGWIEIARDSLITEGPAAGRYFQWDKNLHDRTKKRYNAVNLIKHELFHVIGFMASSKSQAYVATFEPPRPWLDRPVILRDGDYKGLWYETDTRQHHYGPIASPSPDNPWRDTPEPGPRLEDSSIRGTSNHLMGWPGDELAAWRDWSGDFMRDNLVVGRAPHKKVGIARDVMLDVGFARGTWSIQDRRLPRHWYDPTRSGHGLDFRRVEHADGSMQHFLHFYTYDADGNPEWYIATGKLDDRMVLEADLDYVTWEEGRSPKAQADPSRSGTLRLNLDPAIDHPACAGRHVYDPAGSEKWLFAVLDFDLPDGSGTWCLEPLRFGREPAFPHEGTGSWYSADPADSGWGLSVMTRNYGPRPIISTVVYYYDAAGEPTWSIGVAGAGYELPYGSVGDGVEIDMTHVNGFCRTCEPAATSTTPAGTMHIRINSQDADDPDNRILRLDVTDQGPVGGSWQREDVRIHRLSSPHPEMSQ